jgi:thiol-disulfide isomerase/thioredoxin
MKQLSRIFLFLMFVSPTAGSFAAGIDFHHDLTFQQALDKAKREGKLVFIDCYTSWCGPCKRLAATVFTDSMVGEYFNNNFVNVKFDMEKDEGVSIATRYQVTAYPTLIWLDGNGSIKNKVIGGLDAVGLINGARTATPPIPEAMIDMDRKYAAGARDEAFLEEYLKLFKSSNRDYEVVYAEYLRQATAQNWPKANIEPMVFDLTNSYPSPGLALLAKYKNDLVAKYGEKPYNDKIKDISEDALALAKNKSDEKVLHDAITLVKENMPDNKQEIARMEMDYYMTTGKVNDYDKYVTEYIKKFGAEDPKVLNDAAWQYYIGTDERKYLKKASDWAYKAVNLKNTCVTNTTYAYLQYKLGNLSEATKACDYAIIKAKEESFNPVSALALKKEIQKETKKP